MATILTGGTGKTSRRVAQLLSKKGVPFVLASRNAPSSGGALEQFPFARFDWTDTSTYAAPFAKTFPNGAMVETAYLMSPRIADPVPPMKAFIDYARSRHGVQRFVLVAGTTAQPGSSGIGEIWQHFIDAGVEYCVLRPSWFMENLTEEAFGLLVRKFGTIWSATGDGEIPFISADDIAAVAAYAITLPKLPNCDYRLLGPDLLTYDNVAEILTKATGRQITHVKLSAEERETQLAEAGLPAYLAGFLTQLEVKTSQNMEKGQNTVVSDLTGHAPKSFEQSARENADAWRPLAEGLEYRGWIGRVFISSRDLYSPRD